MRQFRFFVSLTCVWFVGTLTLAEETHPPYFLWPPADTNLKTADVGRILPARVNEDPPAIRITDIENPYLKRFDPAPDKQTGSSVVIVPGGGYRYAVVGKEGAEIAQWFNSLGVTAFVLHYRSPTNAATNDWIKPVQDVQRSVRLIRKHSKEWHLDPQKIGVIGFSAGGNAAAIASTKMDVSLKTDQADEIDEVSCRPDFTMLLYPWKLLNTDATGLREEVVVDAETPPTLLIHTHDDGVTSLSSIEFYKAMKIQKRPAELHIYQSGGHGYGLRPVKDSDIHHWVEIATAWLQRTGVLTTQ